MNNNAWFKKEKPLLSLQSMGGGASGSLMQGAATKTYVDEVFSTYVWTGSGSSTTISNGLDLSGEGGMTWIKNRTNSNKDHVITDTARGAGNAIFSNSSSSNNPDANKLASFTSTGFGIGTDSYVNGGSDKMSSWSFRKAKGFFTCLTYVGDGVDGRSISHSLGCIPGMWIVKRTDGTDNWTVGHSRTLGGTGDDYKWHMHLNTNDAKDANGEFTYNSPPTATTLSLGASNKVNGNGNSYVCYLFAGGESTAATARSVDYDGSDDNTVWQNLSGDNADDLTFGTGDFTVEGWAKPDSIANYPAICDFRSETSGSSSTDGFWLGMDGGILKMWSGGAYLQSTGIQLYAGVWFHFAVVKNSGTIKIFINGIQSGSDYTTSTNFNNSYYRKMRIGAGFTGADLWNGKISNFRVTKGQALYTTAFKPSTEPLTTTSQGATASNVKLLCCNNSSTTGSTVTPVTPANNGSPTASTDSPFDDPDGFKFGEDADQNIIKTGSYTGNGSDDGPEIYLGWEPQWILLKRTDSTDNWPMYDVMRGITSEGTDNQLRADQNAVEHTTGTTVDVTSTGFKITTLGSEVNASSGEYVYMAIRGTDGSVAKPAEAGTDSFNVVLGAGNATIPDFAANFAVSMGIVRQYGNTQNNYIASRLTGTNYLQTNSDTSESSTASFVFDSNAGWNSNSNNTNISWMWKRGQGFDSVTWTGDDVAGRDIPHNLNAVPEMIWVKSRSATEPWAVYHHGANGGTTPWNYYGKLNMSSSFSSSPNMWNQTAPTSTAFQVIADNMVNGAPKTYVSYLFSSVTGISKVSSYTGTGSSGLSVTTGFQPRFLIIKRSDAGSTTWLVFDSVRGFASGDDSQLSLDTDIAAVTNTDFGQFTSTGFTINETYAEINNNGGNYLYYAHA